MLELATAQCDSEEELAKLEEPRLKLKYQSSEQVQPMRKYAIRSE